MKSHAAVRCAGISLLESLIAMVIFSVGLLALAQMQLFALHMTKNAEQISMAAQRAVIVSETSYVARRVTNA